MLKLTTDKHEASRDLSATAKLLVWTHTVNFNALKLLNYSLFQFPVPAKYSL